MNFTAKLRKRREQCLPKPDPMLAPDYTEADVQAIRACVRGDADAEQQKRAIDFIINDICGTYDSPMRSNDKDTYIAGGKQRVGQIIVWFLNVAPVRTSIDAISARISQEKKYG